MVAQALDIERETYLAFLMDRTCSGPVIVGSPMGGMDIEEVAQKHPDAIHKVCSSGFVYSSLLGRPTYVSSRAALGFAAVLFSVNFKKSRL